MKDPYFALLIILVLAAIIASVAHAAYCTTTCYHLGDGITHCYTTCTGN